MNFKIKKIIPYCFILIILVGLFGAGPEVSAQGAADPSGFCNYTDTSSGTAVRQIAATSVRSRCQGAGEQWFATEAQARATPGAPTTGGTAPTGQSDNKSDFEKLIEGESCFNLTNFDMMWCGAKFSYYILYLPATLLLWVSANLFNVLIAVTLSSAMFSGSVFIQTAWAVTRDLSNIFFILILLYIAIKMILGIGGHDVKKMIVNVVLMALLINFSMFFTQVVIDTSNILALVFYNKLEVRTTTGAGADAKAIPYDSVTGEKDISGAMVNAFNPTLLLDNNFFGKVATQKIPGGLPVTDRVPGSIVMGITLIAAALMIYAAYAFFIAGISFMGRMIELFVLIIFSPFAFMSFSIPELEKIGYLGWTAWKDRLLTTAFMAPIFMFFMYFIFRMIQAKIFANLTTNNGGALQTILFVIIPALVILILLMKATEFAKKGGGQFAAVVTSGAKIISGVALGAATGGAALAGTALIGGAGGSTANKLASGANRFGAWSEKKFGTSFGANKLASGLTSVGAYAQKSSFDIRGIKIGGKSLASVTGIPMGEAKQGGYTQRRKEQVEKRMKRAELLNVREDEGLKQALNKTEGDLQELLATNAREIESVDKLIEKKRQEAIDAKRQFDAGMISPAKLKTYEAEAKDAKDRKTALVNGKNFTDLAGTTHSYSTTAVTRDGSSIDELEKQKKIDVQAIKTETARRKRAFANRITTRNRWTKNITRWATLGITDGIDLGSKTEREAAAKIRADAKLDSGTKT